MDVRVVAATNRNLADMVAAKEFREDLFYRLSVIPVDVPPLRERPADIPLLVNHFIDGFNSEFHMQVASVSEEAMAYLCAQAWPGNVRELRNAIERLMLTIDGTEVRLAHVSPEAGGGTRTGVSPRTVSSSAPGAEWPFASEGVPTLVELERWGIRRAIEATGNNKTKAAEMLGISRQTLRMKLKEADAEDGPAVTGFDAVH